MTPAEFLSASRVLIVAGKGGVGKTTATAVLAVAAARAGLRTLLVDLEGKSDLPRLLGTEAFSYEPSEIALTSATGRGYLSARTITADHALLDYLDNHGLKRIGNRMVAAGVVEIVSAATPGLRDILVLGKVRSIEQEAAYDLIIVDAPASGHALSFLRSASGLVSTVSAGAIHTQSTEVIEMLGDPERCRVVLVTLPEETPVNETVETAYALEDEIGIMLGPVIVNGIWPAPDALFANFGDGPAEQAELEALSDAERQGLGDAVSFRTAVAITQTDQITRLTERLPLPLLRLPFVFTSVLSTGDITGLSTLLADELAEVAP